MAVAVVHAVFEECHRCDFHPQIRVAIEAALRWLSENPIVPTLEQVNELMPLPTVRDIIAEWQRRMFTVEIQPTHR